MQKDTPITNDTLSSDSVLGTDLELLIRHKAYIDLAEGDKEKKEGKKDAYKD